MQSPEGKHGPISKNLPSARSSDSRPCSLVHKANYSWANYGWWCDRAYRRSLRWGIDRRRKEASQMSVCENCKEKFLTLAMEKAATENSLELSESILEVETTRLDAALEEISLLRSVLSEYFYEYETDHCQYSCWITAEGLREEREKWQEIFKTSNQEARADGQC